MVSRRDDAFRSACFEVIIDMVAQACATGGYARAMESSADAGLLEIEADVGRRVFGRLTAEGEALLGEEP
jgi:hypothetical protein